MASVDFENCPLFLQKKCSSCGLMNLTYLESISYKAAKIAEIFPGVPSLPFQALNNPFLSRYKAKVLVSGSCDQASLGYLQDDGAFVALESCPLHTPEIRALLEKFPDWIREFRLTPYDVPEQKGEFKGLILLQTPGLGEGHLHLIMRSKESLDRLKKLLPLILTFAPWIKVVSVGFLAKAIATFATPEKIFLTEETWVHGDLLGKRLAFRADHFMQVTPEMAGKLYEGVSSKVRQALKENKDAHILDLYCGSGAFSFFLADLPYKITGVEISSESIQAAERIKVSKHLGDHLQFFCDDSETFLKKNQESYAAMIVNPPRRGLGKSFSRLLLEKGADWLFYSSCNLETLKEDAEILKTSYQLQELQGLDMFPFTTHFETLAIFKRL